MLPAAPPPTATPLLVEEVLHGILSFAGIHGTVASLLVVAGLAWHYGGEAIQKAMSALFVVQVLLYASIGVAVLAALGIATGTLDVGTVQVQAGVVWGWIQAILDVVGGFL